MLFRSSSCLFFLFVCRMIFLVSSYSYRQRFSVFSCMNHWVGYYIIYIYILLYYIYIIYYCRLDEAIMRRTIKSMYHHRHYQCERDWNPQLPNPLPWSCLHTHQDSSCYYSYNASYNNMCTQTSDYNYHYNSPYQLPASPSVCQLQCCSSSPPMYTRL